MRMDTSVLLLIPLLTTLFGQEVNGMAGMVCSSNPNCTCTSILHPYVSSNCSGLGLFQYPNFSNYVTEIDLSRNNFSVFPSCDKLPMHLVTLNLSHNSISSFQYSNNTCTFEFLQTLNLDSNSIEISSLNADVFKSLKNLRELNIKNNFGDKNSKQEYPDVLFSNLKRLQSLKIDGLDNKGFGKGFGKMNNLTMLDLSGHTGKCNIPFLPSGYFYNVKHLRILDISSCDFLRINVKTFNHLKHLYFLDISYNTELTFRVLSNITNDLQYTSIKILKINKIYRTFGLTTELYIEDVKYLQNTSIRVIEMDSNRLETIEKGVISHLPRTLHTVSLEDNMLSFGMYALDMLLFEGIEVIIANKQFSTHPPQDIFLPKRPESCDKQRRVPCKSGVITPSSLAFILAKTFSHFNTSSTYLPVVPPNLKHVEFTENRSQFTIPAIAFNQNSVTHVNASGNLFDNWYGPVENLDSLKTLDLSNNFCSNVSKDFFRNLTSLQHLRININLLGFILEKDANGLILGHLNHLRSLDMSQNQIQSLPLKFFRGLRKLEILDISNNIIRDWTFEIRHMRFLKHIDLSGNRIAFIGKIIRDDIDEMTKTGNISINLKNNEMLCNCFSLPFLNWIQANKKRFTDFEHYICRLQNDTLITFNHLSKTTDYLEVTCHSKTTLIIIVSIAIFCSILIVILGILYRFQWKIRYLYYLAQNKYRGFEKLQSEGENDPFEFDAFISYADEDRHFVINDMIHNLEEEGNCRLCIHHRDFLPGLDIAANITNAINISRKTIIVLSEHFLKSDWCIFEFNMARMESLYSRNGRDVLFVILYGNVKMANVPMQMMEQMTTQSYIEFTSDEDGNILFWKKVLNAIKH